MVGSSRKRILRLVQQRSRDFQPPLHAAGESFHQALSAIFESHKVQEHGDAFGPFRRGYGVEDSVQIHIFLRRQLVIQAGILKHDPERSSHLLLVVRRVVPVHAHLSRTRHQHRGQHLDGGRFPRSVRP